MSGGATTAATETADEVEVVISGAAGAGGVIALKFFPVSHPTLRLLSKEVIMAMSDVFAVTKTADATL